MIVATAAWCCGAEAVDEQVLEIAERHAAIDRPPRGKGDDQRVRAPRRALGPLRSHSRPGRGGFRASAIRAASEATPCSLRGGWQRTAFTSGRLGISRLRRCAARCRESARQAGNARGPRSRPRRRRGCSTSATSSRAPQPMPVRCRAVHSGCGLLHSLAARASSASSVGCSATSTDFQPAPAASAAASLIAAIDDGAAIRHQFGKTSAGAGRMDQGDAAVERRRKSRTVDRLRSIDRKRRDRLPRIAAARAGPRRTDAASCKSGSIEPSSRSTPASPVAAMSNPASRAASAVASPTA